MENPFIEYWLWYYDVLWHYWPIIVLLAIIVMLLKWRRYIEQKRELDEMRKSRKNNEDCEHKVYENDIVEVDLNKIKRIDHFEKVK